jgi:hypothetical protein
LLVDRSSSFPGADLLSTLGDEALTPTTIMPKIPQQQDVYCANCNRAQPDEGRGKACYNCGTSPLPSYSYPSDCSFYPQPRKESQANRIARLVEERRAMSHR